MNRMRVSAFHPRKFREKIRLRILIIINGLYYKVGDFRVYFACKINVLQGCGRIIVLAENEL